LASRRPTSIPIISNQAPRSTATITTTAYNINLYERLALLVITTLDQAVNITAEYSRDGVTYTQIGAALNVAANAGGKAYGVSSIEAFSLLGGWLRFKATPVGVPTVGNLTVEFQADN
jgi:hypothetical protein